MGHLRFASFTPIVSSSRLAAYLAAFGYSLVKVLQKSSDKIGNTLTVWFDDPTKEDVSEETGEEVILMKDKQGRVIGFEKLNFATAETEPLQVAFEAMAV
jgi:hypothetical protein